ncbi:lipid-A-disaccharide synthase [Aestuariibacter sp. A3R04]|uniref:lipid-A-disaccharide synthase n=1 Tax=Aestuariibacter sp. A3R04 TaxID=2841571 RepID=UPI001C09FFD0|nr:lipid-A-disaccharide synthase [Aestuariibacter sp. A3R04]MBU3022131.1 lipid-A-disaccharide synthase [Aestuariibacter sp. A3R04]
MPDSPLRIAIVAGEPSGDVLAAGMVAELRKRYPNAILEGIGGDNMKRMGFHSLFDMETLSVMGLVEVLRHLPAILKVKNDLLAYLEKFPPDVYVGVDAPDFNLRVEKVLKQRGIKTVHYVSPTVWAWREKRIHKIKAAASRVLGLFPFEAQVYEKYQVPYTFVGHTLADAIELAPDQVAARAALDLPDTGPVMAVLPGSRGGELKALLPVFVATIKQVKQQLPACLFVIPAANQYRMETIQTYLKESVPELVAGKQIRLTIGNARETMVASDVILLASGTATLEAMLCKRPMVSCYKLSSLTYKIMQRLYKAPYFSLPNLLANEKLVPELLQDDVNPETLAAHLLPLFTQDNSALIARFTEIHKALKLNADKMATQAVVEVINE